MKISRVPPSEPLYVVELTRMNVRDLRDALTNSRIDFDTFRTAQKFLKLLNDALFDRID